MNPRFDGPRGFSPSNTTMSHPLVWPTKLYFYPIGNTSPVCLTQDLAPEDPAKILLLGCGDARNILYTLHASANLTSSE
jgi:hypothetical protein